MGVQGLWQLLEPLGRPVSLSSLDNKVLAIDASLWIHQAVRGYRNEAGGGPVANAHLLGAFHRLCKLLLYRIRPVFVFDGSVPTVKRETMAARRERRGDAARDAEKARREILSKQLKLRAIQAVTSEQSSSSVPSQSKDSASVSMKRTEVDMYDLAPMPPCLNNIMNSSDDEEEGLEADNGTLDSDEGFRFHESSYQNLEEIELDSSDFQALPLEIQHEILLQLKEKLKRKSWTALTQMPSEAEEIGSYQIRQLLKRRKVQQKLDSIRKEMNKSVLYDFEDGEPNENVEMHRIASEDSSYYMLLKKPRGATNPSSGRHKELKEEISQTNPSDREVCSKNAQKLTPDIVDSRLDSSHLAKSYNESSSDRLELSEESDCSSEVIECARREEDKIIRSVTKCDGLEFGSQVSRDNNTETSELRCDSELVVQEATCNFALEAVSTQKEKTEGFIIGTESALNNMTPGVISEPSSESKTPEIVIDVEDDDDFIEVDSDQADSPKSPDELFPLECFQSSDDVGSKVDVDSKLPTEVEPSSSPLNWNKHEDLALLSEQLEEEMTGLAQALGRQERVAATITDQMYAEIQELLRLFGVPYVVSPAEAEAQCAVLDVLELTQGTITDDSDVWLFGATRVYKNFFNQSRELLFFKGADVQQRLGLDRRKLIALALLMGSDYTDGVKGIGRVSAVELLAEFASGSRDGDDDDGIECLHRFRTWWDKTRKQKRVPKNETKIKKNLRAVTLHEGFPSPVVVKAYLEPTVDTSTEPFSWARPDLHELRQFAYNKFGWNNEKTDGMLLPVIKQLNSQEHQLPLTAYFERASTADSGLTPAARGTDSRQPSRRLCRAIKRVKNGGYMDEDDVPVKSTRAETTVEIGVVMEGAGNTIRRKNPKRATTSKANK